MNYWKWWENIHSKPTMKRSFFWEKNEASDLGKRVTTREEKINLFISMDWIYHSYSTVHWLVSTLLQIIKNMSFEMKLTRNFPQICFVIFHAVDKKSNHLCVILNIYGIALKGFEPATCWSVFWSEATRRAVGWGTSEFLGQLIALLLVAQWLERWCDNLAAQVRSCLSQLITRN